jgi:hypothetical protein
MAQSLDFVATQLNFPMHAVHVGRITYNCAMELGGGIDNPTSDLHNVAQGSIGEGIRPDARRF